MLKNEISNHQICLQSVLKHSVGHSQGIGMKFESFFFQTIFGQNRHVISTQLSYHKCVVCIFDVNTVVLDI